MKLIPNYSYEFNCILNENFTEDEQIKNFASLLTDKDRFLSLLYILEDNSKLIEEKLGYKLKENFDFYVIRAEKFKSFSLPITIEYSILPEEMLLFLLKEIVKTSILDRFPDEIIREIYVNSFIEYISINGDFGKLDLTKFVKNLHNESLKNFKEYLIEEIDFENLKMSEHVERLFNEEMIKRG